MPLTDGARLPRDDRAIEQDVREEIAVDPGITGLRLLGIAVENGAVRLTGSADSFAQRWAIIRAAGRVLGVREVRDLLDVRPPDGILHDDCAVARAARRVLEWDARVPNGISAEVTDGVLRLHGTASRFPERAAAEEATRNLIGVRDVVNEIRVAPAEPSPPPADLAEHVGDALRRRFGLGTGYVSIAAADGVVTLSGVAPTFATLDDVERAIRSIPGVTRLDNRLLVSR